ncbi:MAG: glycosyltransferase family 9 protein [Chloroflexota bacterium]
MNESETGTGRQIPVSDDRWQQARRILCVRLDFMGDVLMTTPAIRALREGGTDRHITLLGSGSGAAVARLVPEIDHVITYDAPWVKSTPPRANSSPDAAMIARLREENFDAAVIFTVYSQNPLPAAFLCHMSDIPLRLAYCRENSYQLLSDWAPEVEPEHGIRHEVRRHLDLVASVGAQTNDERLSVSFSDTAKQRVYGKLEREGLALDSPWVVIHPGATAESRRYPAESFARAARRLVLEHGVQVVLSGARNEAELLERIRHLMAVPAVSLAGALDLEQLAALLYLCPLLIVNNTGPAHLAAAVGTPVVDLYALTNPQHTPWGVPSRVLFHDVPCKYCYRSICVEGHHNCLRLVPPAAVVSAALELLGEKESTGQTERPGLFAPALA